MDDEPKCLPADHGNPEIELNIGSILQRLEKERWKEPTDKETAQVIGIQPTTYSEIKSGTKAPTLRTLRLLCQYFKVPMETFTEGSDHFVQQRGALRWHVRDVPADAGLLRTRNVAEWTLMGESPGEIASRIAGPDPMRVKHAEATITPMARAGLDLDLVELVLEPDGREIQNTALADELATALSAHARPPRPVSAHVVRNLTHPGFERDPLVPFLIARVAHRAVACFLEEHPLASTLGIAGGIHLGTFVRRTGRASAPFPRSGNRRFNLVPLTLEPFHEHSFDHADALVGELHHRAARLLGAPQVHAPSFKPFGFLEDQRIGALESDAILMVRDLYHRLDAAIFGCGDRSDDGWIGWTEKMLEVRLDAATDVCLNMIDQRGAPIPLPEHAGRQRQYLGVTIDHIRGLAARKDKLALLLTSGKSKGLPITLVARAGCVNHVICDEAAARAALDALAKKGTASGPP